MKRLGRNLLIFLGLLVLLASIWSLWYVNAQGQHQRALQTIKDAGLPTTREDLYPPTIPLEENAAPIYQKAFDILKGAQMQTIPYLEEPPEVPEDMRTYLTQVGEALELAREAAKLPRCQFELEYSDGFAMLLYHIAAIRQLARLLEADAYLLLEKGDVSGAVENVQTLFAMARHLREERILISQLVRFAISGIGLTTLEQVLPRCESAVATLEEIEMDDGLGGMAIGIQGEIVMALTIGEEVTGGNLNSLFGLGSGGVGGVNDALWAVGTPIGRPYLDADTALLAEALFAYWKTMQLPYPDAFSEMQIIEKDADAEGGYFVQLMLPSLTTAFQAEAKLAARVELARLAARILDWQKEHGTFPPDLTPFGEVIDPFTGLPFLLTEDEGVPVLESQGTGEVNWRFEKEE